MIYRVSQKNRFFRRPQIASGQNIYQNIGNFFGDYVHQVWWHMVLSSFGSARKLPKIGPKSRVTSELKREFIAETVRNSLTLCVSVPKNRSPITAVTEE